MKTDPNAKHPPYQLRTRLTTAGMITKTASYKKTYSFPIPKESFLLTYLLWFDKNREELTKLGTGLYDAIGSYFETFTQDVTKAGGWTPRVFRCYRATEFVYRWKEWELIVANKKNTDDDVEPENPLQHLKIGTTLKHYANVASRAELEARARVVKNK